MSNLAELSPIGVADDLAGEAVATIRHEYVAGQVFAMAGASEGHATIAGNVCARTCAADRAGSTSPT